MINNNALSKKLASALINLFAHFSDNVLTNIQDISMDTMHHHDNQIIQLQAAITDLTKQIQGLKCQLQNTDIHDKDTL